jgi:hypothetical protein
VLEAQANIQRTWEELFDTANIKDRDSPLVTDLIYTRTLADGSKDYNSHVGDGCFDPAAPDHQLIMYIA